MLYCQQKGLDKNMIERGQKLNGKVENCVRCRLCKIKSDFMGYFFSS